MSFYELFGPSALVLPIRPVEAPVAEPKNAKEFLERMIMEGKIIPAIPAVKNTAEKEIDSMCDKMEKSWPSFLLPEAEEKAVTLTEKVFVPMIPGYNFIGRLLGPRGSTIRRLSDETGCTIQVRGRGSMRNQEMEKMLRNAPKWENLKEELHVVIQCEDKERRCREKMAKARHYVKALIQPMENDKVKEMQLMELALLNGTYRPLPNQTILPFTTPPPVKYRNSLVTLTFVE